MRDNIVLILFCVFFIILDTLVLGYSIGRIYPPIPVMTSAQTSTSSARKEKQQDLLEKQELTENMEQQKILSEQTQKTSTVEQQATTITEEEAIRIVELDYQADGHIVVMNEDDKSYTIGCFWEMYFDEETGEALYNMQAAEYVINKYSGEILSVTKQSDNAIQIENNTTQQVAPHIYTREEVNAMFRMDWVDGCGVYMESELDESMGIKDEIINGETCYIGNVVWGNGRRTRTFYVGNQSLKVYASDATTYVGMVTEDFASALELY